MEKNPVNALPEVPANPFVELGSVVGTLENVSDAIEQVRFTLGEIGFGKAQCVPEGVYKGHFWTLLGVLKALEYIRRLLESEKGTEPEPTVSQIPA